MKFECLSVRSLLSWIIVRLWCSKSWFDAQTARRWIGFKEPNSRLSNVIHDGRYHRGGTYSCAHICYL